MKQISNQIRDQISNQVWNQVHSQVHNEVHYQVSPLAIRHIDVEDKIRSQVYEQVQISSS